MLNHIVIMGRLTRDPELSRTGSGISLARFTVAVDRDFSSKNSGEKETDFVDCVAWRQKADFLGKYFSKGSMIVVSGRLQIDNWTDKDGNKRKSAAINADDIYFGGSKRDSNQSQNQSGYGNNYNGGYAGNAAPAASVSGGFAGYAPPGGLPESDYAILEDDDAQLPF